MTRRITPCHHLSPPFHPLSHPRYHPLVMLVLLFMLLLSFLMLWLLLVLLAAVVGGVNTAVIMSNIMVLGITNSLHTITITFQGQARTE